MPESGLMSDRGALKLGRLPLHLVPSPTMKGDGDALKENFILGREVFGSIRCPPPFPGGVQGPILKGPVFSCCAGLAPTTV